MESITIKVDSLLAKEIDTALQPYYSTRTEFIREAIRDKLAALKDDHLVREFLSLRGCVKKKTSPEAEERIRKDVGRRFADKFGIDLVDEGYIK